MTSKNFPPVEKSTSVKHFLAETFPGIIFKPETIVDLKFNLESAQNSNPIIDYLALMKKYQVNTSTPHWLPPFQISQAAVTRVLTRYFCACGQMQRFSVVKRLCNSPRCLNPIHYQVKPQLRKTGLSESEYSRQQFLFELAEVIDLKAVARLGLATYTEQFNSEQPLPELCATEAQMELAIKIALGAENTLDGYPRSKKAEM